MRSTTIAAAGAAAALLCAGPALAATKTFEVAAFTAIEISSGIDATIIIGEPQSVVAEAPSAEQFEDLVVEVKDGRLRAYTDRTLLPLRRPLRTRNIPLTGTVPAVTAIESNSGADVTAADIAADLLALGLLRRQSQRPERDGGNDRPRGLERRQYRRQRHLRDRRGRCHERRRPRRPRPRLRLGRGRGLERRPRRRAGHGLARSGSPSGGDIEVFGNPPSRNVERSSAAASCFRD